MRRVLLVSALALAACGGEPAAPPEQPPRRGAPPDAPAQAPTVVAARRETVEGKGAAAALRRYYDHVEAGRYRDAWSMRSASEVGLERFEQNFAVYERYRVTLGPPTEPVEAGGWTYVEVPIQIHGTLKGGKGFGSVGSVTMRRATGAAESSPRDREWHIYTG